MRWPKGPPHLALNPPYLICFSFLFFFCFLVFAFARKTLFSPQKGHFLCIFFCVSLCFFLAFFELPDFSLSLCLSLVLFLLPSFLFFIFVSGSCFFFLFLLLCFKMLFCFCCFAASCFVLNHHVGFLFALHLVFWLLFVVVFCSSCFAILLFFYIFGSLPKNISEKMEIRKTAKMKNAEKMDILTRAVSTVVFTNSVVFSFFVFFFFFFAFLLKHYKNRGFNQNLNKKTKTITHFIS